MGIGDWGLGIEDWGLGPIPNPQSPIPNPQSPIPTKNYFLSYLNIFLFKFLLNNLLFFKQKKMNSNIQNTKLLIQFEKNCYSRLYNNYNITPKSFNKLIISNIIYNNKLHIVCCFKEFLIFFDPGDFLSSYYKIKDSKGKIKDYCEFYCLNSRIFPNYILLPESEYIFNNIKKKQKLLSLYVNIGG